MIDIFLLIVIISITIILLISSLYILAYYSNPDDTNFGSSLICKIISILGLTITFGEVLLLPLDISNIRGDLGGLRMDLIWKITYITIAIFIFIIIPFANSFYECDPDSTFCQKIFGSFCFFFFEIIIIALIFFLGFLFFGKADIPISSFECNIDKSININETINLNNTNLCGNNSNSYLNIKVGFPIFSIGLLSFISNFFFVLFCGIGIFSFPLDMIYSFCTRPERIKKTKIEEIKSEIVSTAVDLKELALSIKKMEKEGDDKKPFYSKEKRNYKNKLNELKMGVSVLDQQYEIIDIQNIIDGKGIIQYYCNFYFGIFFLIISFIWITHILLYLILKKNNQPMHLFLNKILLLFTEKNLNFLSIGIFSLFCFYLLISTIKGNFKFGLRFLFFTIHPMKRNETYMNSILFNIMLLMLTSVAVTQFCVKAFNDYAAMTDIDLIFSYQIQYLTFFSFFFKYHIFEYIFYAVVIISFIYLICRPNDTKTMKKILYKELEIEKNKKGKLIELQENVD